MGICFSQTERKKINTSINISIHTKSISSVPLFHSAWICGHSTKHRESAFGWVGTALAAPQDLKKKQHLEFQRAESAIKSILTQPEHAQRLLEEHDPACALA